MNTEHCPFKTPAVGSQVKIACGDDTECPFADRLPVEALEGWQAFFQGQEEPQDFEGKRGWNFAKGHKQVREAHEWTFKGTEKRDDGWYAVLTRTEPRCLDDVYNGSGTGLGTVTFTERVKLGE